MLTFLSENPWPLTGLFGGVCALCLVILMVTGRGPFLIGGLVSGGLALLVLLVEAFWVTDIERIEAVVQEIARGVRDGDEEAVAEHLADGLDLQLGNIPLPLPDAIELPLLDPIDPSILIIRTAMDTADFDMIRITAWDAIHAGQQSRQGYATFSVLARGEGSYGGPGNRYPFTVTTHWTLGFREIDGQWKVDQIKYLGGPQGLPSYMTGMTNRVGTFMPNR